MLDSNIYLQLGAIQPIFDIGRCIGTGNNDFKAKNYCFLRKKVGGDRATSPLYEPGVYHRFEI